MTTVNQIYTNYATTKDISKFTVEDKRTALRMYAITILEASDWTQLPSSVLTLAEQIEQQELRATWMELDDPNLDPDTITLPPYPLMERL